MRVRASEEMRRGDVFIAMHWGTRFTSGLGSNALTLPALDPRSRQPELKHAAVRIERFEAAWRDVMLLATETVDQALAAHRQVTPLLQYFDYGAVAMVESDRIVLSVEVASAVPPPAEILAELNRLLPLAQPPDLTGLPRARVRTVCSCLNVSEEKICAAAASGRTLQEIQSAFMCGTQCGSCVTELKRLVAESPRIPVAAQA